MTSFRPTIAEINLDAIRNNIRTLTEVAAPAAVLAVVKADAYGHGALPVARAALEAGASWLGVALVEEGVQLREAGIDCRVLVLSEPPAGAEAVVVEHRLTPTVYTNNGIEALAKAVADAGSPPLAVHLKVDTGMHRVGCAPDDALALFEAVNARPELQLEGVWTHLAVADQPENTYTDEQLDLFEDVLSRLPDRPAIVHASNSAGVLCHERAHFDMVRIGIAMYGVPPAPGLEDRAALQPAMSLRSSITHVKSLPPGTRLSYGLHFEVPGGAPARIATVPVGYADGVSRGYGMAGGQVLVRGTRCPIVGTVTMDQLMVDVSALDPVPEVGERVTLLGRDEQDGGERDEITANEWAERLGVIGYEVTTRVGPRVPRHYEP